MIKIYKSFQLRQELGLPYFSDASHYVEYTQQSFEDEIKLAGMNIGSLQINLGEIWAEVMRYA